MRGSWSLPLRHPSDPRLSSCRASVHAALRNHGQIRRVGRPSASTQGDLPVRSLAPIVVAAMLLPFAPVLAQEQLTGRLNFRNPAGEPNGTGTVAAMPVGVLFTVEVRGL